MIQHLIDEQDIQSLANLRPRRCKLCSEWPRRLYEPSGPGKDWVLIMPFRATFYNAFLSMTAIRHIAHDAPTGKLCLYLPDANDDEGVRFEALGWTQKVGTYVAIRDNLALSFALDFEREDGNPSKPQTEVGRLRTRAKPYDTNPTTDTYIAAGLLAKKCTEFLRDMSCYSPADSVVAMPGASPIKAFDLPTTLAKGIATAWGKEDLTQFVRIVKKRRSLKSARFDEKLDAIRDTIEVKEGIFDERIVLLVDDLYQSGISVNYFAMLLLRAGARMVFGLACEKTCRNDDNMGGGSGQ
jgi:hypothetical protein